MNEMGILYVGPDNMPASNKKVKTSSTNADSRLPRSAHIDMAVVVDKFSPIPFPALAFL